MPEINESEVPKTSQSIKRSERTEAKFFEHVELMIAEGERLGAAYDPPNSNATVANLKATRDAALAARAANQASEAAEENERRQRENLFKPLNSDVTGLVGYARSYGVAPNQLDALQSIARDVKSQRAEAVDKRDGKRHISVSNASYATRADNYARFIEQYETLAIPTNEDQFKPATHRAKQAALAAANNSVITADSNTNTTGEQLDKLAYTDADSLMNACIPAKAYILSKYKKTGQPYKNIAKTRFRLPSRLRS